MAIYTSKDKFRVDLEVPGHGRITKLFHSRREAVAAEKAWKQGKDLPVKKGAPGASRDAPGGTPKTILALVSIAAKSRWATAKDRLTQTRRAEIVAGIIGPMMRPEDLTSDHMEMVVQTFEEKGRSWQTINKHLSNFNVCVKYGARKGWCKPLDLEDLWQDGDEDPIYALTHAQEEALLGFLRGNHPQMGLLCEIALKTGMRRGELLGLDPDVHLRHPGRVELDVTKAGSPRTIPVTPETEGLIRELVSYQDPLSEYEVRYWWNKAKAAMGLQGEKFFRFHALRHTCATRLIEKNINIRVVQKFMGHKRIETTLRYAHVNDGLLIEAAAAIS